MTHAELMSDVVSVLADPRMAEPMRRVLAGAMLITEAGKAEAEPALREAVSEQPAGTLRKLGDRRPSRRRPLWHEGVELYVFMQRLRDRIVARRMGTLRTLTLIEGGAQ